MLLNHQNSITDEFTEFITLFTKGHESTKLNKIVLTLIDLFV